MLSWKIDTSHPAGRTAQHQRKPFPQRARLMQPQYTCQHQQQLQQHTAPQAGAKPFAVPPVTGKASHAIAGSQQRSQRQQGFHPRWRIRFQQQQRKQEHHSAEYSKSHENGRQQKPHAGFPNVFPWRLSS